MKVVTISSALVAALGLTLTLAACAAKDDQKGNTKKSGASDGDDESAGEDGGADGESEGEDGEGAQGSTGTTGTKSKAVSQEAAANADLEGWCAKAAETDAIKGKLKAYFPKFCANGKPTKLLSTTLLAAPYSGQGAPALTDIEALKSASGNTSYYFAVAIKIPISLKTHFEKVGPSGGDPVQLKKTAEAGGSAATITMKDEFEKVGKYQVRGWLYNQLVKRKVAIVTISTEIELRHDQHELVPGKHYLYTQYIDKSIQTMTSLDQITAGIEMDGAHMLLSIIHVVTGNKNFPEIAEKEILATANNTVKDMYALAAAYKGPEVKVDAAAAGEEEEPAADEEEPAAALR